LDATIAGRTFHSGERPEMAGTQKGSLGVRIDSVK